MKFENGFFFFFEKTRLSKKRSFITPTLCERVTSNKSTTTTKPEHFLETRYMVPKKTDSIKKKSVGRKHEENAAAKRSCSSCVSYEKVRTSHYSTHTTCEVGDQRSEKQTTKQKQVFAVV
jgi:hypothetical protein